MDTKSPETSDSPDFTEPPKGFEATECVERSDKICQHSDFHTVDWIPQQLRIKLVTIVIH